MGVPIFGIVAVIGLALVLLDIAAKANDPTPSLYNSGFTSIGIGLLVIGVVGAGASYLI